MQPLSSRRYAIQRVLGRGGMGVVYEAFDSKDRTLVALKTIDPGEAEHLYRLKREFRALADVQHKNIVRFGELSHEEGQWFFSMELVRGKNFIDYIRLPGRKDDNHAAAATTILRNLLRNALAVDDPTEVAPPREVSFDEDRLRDSLAQLVSALSAIHDAGHVHRDVKPSNILVSDEGRLVLLDFGLVLALAKAGRTEAPDELVGTPAFMAPEQLSGEPGGPEADWYAVGVILHIALTGMLPFDGNAGDICRAKKERAAPAPSSIAQGVPPDLDRLCVDLLHRDTSQRPGADAIRARLGMTMASRGTRLAPAAAPFVGRGPELAVIARAHAAVRAGRGQRVVVEGEPGVGKSALVQRFLATATGDPVVLAGRCYEQESVPFKGLDSIVDALSEHLLGCDEATVNELLAGGVRYLATVFPVLARVPAVAGTIAESRSVASEGGLREQAFRELERLIDALGRRRPLVVCLDDVQWADADSLALLRRLVLRANAVPCLFLATFRPGIEPPQWAELSVGSERLVLGGLGEEESRALWDVIGPAATTPGATALRDEAVEEAAGHPLFLAELALAARSGHTEACHLRLEDVLWRRIQERDPIEQRFMEMLAFAGAPAPCEAVARAADLDVGECVTRLGGLKAAQLVRVTRRGEERLVEPYHARIRESLVERLAGEGEGRTAQRHLRLGRALHETSDAGSLPHRVFAILLHLDAARSLIATRPERLEVAGLHLAASRAARLTTAYTRARDHAVLGLSLASEGGWADAYALTRDLWIERMEAEYLGGRPDDARRSFEAARGRLTSPEDKAAHYTSWIALESAHMRFAEALAAGREILEALGAPLPGRVSMAHVLAEHAANRIARGRRSIDDLLRLERLGDPARESAMQVMMALGAAAYCLDTHLFTWMMLRIAGTSMRHGVCSVSSYGFAGYGLVLSAAFRQHAEGAAFGRVALALDERFKDPSLAGKLHFIVASYLAPWTSPIADAHEALRRAYDKSVRCGDRAYEVYAVLHLSVMAFFEGASLETLQATAERGQEISMRRREADIVDDSNAVLALYAANLRSPNAGELAALVADNSVMARFFFGYCRAELAYLSGDAESSAGLLRGAVDPGSRAIFGTIMVVELAWLEALVAARRFDHAPRAARAKLLWTVASRVRKLASLARIRPDNFDAHHLLARAEMLRITGRAARARETTERAIAAARAQGSPKREAIGLTLAADEARRRGETARARELESAARDAHRRWGALKLAQTFRA